MGNLEKDRGKNKSAEALRPSYARFYASKWRSGTLMLTLEEEGLYIRVSAFQMECGQPIPLDWKAGARLLCVQPLKYRKTIDALIAKRKLITTPDGVICERAMHEFKRASRGVVGEKPNPPTNPDTNPHTYPDTNPVSMGVEAEKDERNQTDFRNRREEEEKKEDTPTVEPLAAREGETEIEHGVLVNCETIRHRDFNISLKAIQLQLCGTVPMDEIKSIAQGHAVAWANDIASGKRPSQVVPSNTASFIRASIQHAANKAARLKPKPFKPSRW